MANQDIKIDGRIINSGNKSTKNVGFYGSNTNRVPRNTGAGFIKQEDPFNLTKHIQETAQSLINNDVVYYYDSAAEVSHADANTLDVCTITETLEPGDYKLEWGLDLFDGGAGPHTFSVKRGVTTLSTVTETKTAYYPYGGQYVFNKASLGSETFTLELGDATGASFEAKNCSLVLTKIG
jgi:hypothetical protein